MSPLWVASSGLPGLQWREPAGGTLNDATAGSPVASLNCLGDDGTQERPRNQLSYKLQSRPLGTILQLRHRRVG